MRWMIKSCNLKMEMTTSCNLGRAVGEKNNMKWYVISNFQQKNNGFHPFHFVEIVAWYHSISTYRINVNECIDTLRPCSWHEWIGLWETIVETVPVRISIGESLWKIVQQVSDPKGNCDSLKRMELRMLSSYYLHIEHVGRASEKKRKVYKSGALS